MIWLTLLAFLFLVVRLLVWKKSQVAAIDQYFWVQYRLARRAQPGEVHLPQYLLDVRQWYVPLFGRFLSVLPDGFFRNSGKLMLGISFGRFALILFWCYLFIGGLSVAVALAGAIVFWSSPITAIHDNQLNGRLAGGLLFDLLLAVGFSSANGFSPVLPALMAALACVLFFMHKLTLQLFAICAVLFLLVRNFSWLVALLAGGMLAMLFGYRKYALAHWDISSFWFRNRHLLSAHQINQSPLYGDSSHGKVDWRALAFQSATLIGMCPWAVVLVLARTPCWSTVCALILGVAMCISFVPAFRCWGHGRNYTYFLIAPVIYGLPSLDGQWIASPVFLLLIAGAFGVAGLSVGQYLGWLKKQSSVNDSDFENALRGISGSVVDRICCIPFSMADQVAYRTGRMVFWGGHGYGFKWLEPYFPVFRHPVEQAVSEWNLGGLLLRKSYWPRFIEQVDQTLFETVMENDGYLFLKVVGWQPGIRIPEWAREAYPALKDQLPEDEV